MVKNNIYIYSASFIFFYFIFFACLYIVNYSFIQTYANRDAYANIETEEPVDLPLTFPFSCKNFCGPNNKCAKTGEQCSNDYDCSGCENMNKHKPPPIEPHYRELSKNVQFEQVSVGSINNIVPMHNIKDKWRKNFDDAMKIYYKKMALDNVDSKMMPDYPTRLSVTGQYQDTGAMPYNF